MDPRSKGWLGEYLEYRKDFLHEVTAESHQQSHPDYSLYKLVQPRGLMYGQAVQWFAHPSAEQWDQHSRMKILLAECLLGSALHFQGKTTGGSPDEVSRAAMHSLESISSFYNQIFPELTTSSKTWLGRRRTPVEMAELIIDKRVEHSRQFNGYFWVRLFQQSLLFLDIFIFGQWVHTNADKIVSDFFRYEREELRASLVKVIAAAAHANHILEFEERKMLDHFLVGAQLPLQRRKECLAIFENGVSVEDINPPTNNSWILRKYFLEIAILVVWADKRVEESELDFLRRFADTLGFTAEDMEYSLVAIEGFVLEHWKELDYLQDRKNFTQVSETYNRRLSSLAEKNKARLIREVQSSAELTGLLLSARKRELNVEEKDKLQSLLVDTLKALPAFGLVALPRQYLTLPVLMQVLPRHFIAECLPSN